MENRRDISDDDQDDNDSVAAAADYFPAENHSHYKSKKTEVVPFCNLRPEDLRISKLLRRLSSVNDPRLGMELCRKLELISQNKENANYIRRTIDFLAESIITIMRKGPIELLDILPNILGQFGYIARQDFAIFKAIILKSYDSFKDIRIHLMRSLMLTVRFDANTLELGIYGNGLFHHLKNYLENSNVTDEFIAVTDCIVEFSKNYHESFEKHFTDIVDILVGWHLQVDQTLQFKGYCSEILQELSKYFVNNIEFTFGLLNQFLEDVIIFGTETENTSETQRERVVESFVGAITAVLKCLAKEKQILAYKSGDQFFYDAVQIIAKTTTMNLKRSSNSDTILITNEFFILILGYVDVSPDIKLHNIIEIIEIEETFMTKFDNARICSLLLLILTTIREFQTAIPLSLIEFLTCKNSSSFYLLKFSNHDETFKLLLQIYQEILMITNVPLLQEAYKNIIADANNAIQVILQMNVNEYQEYTLLQAEYVLNFYLCALSILAAQSSSIIAMYALQPSILELCIKICQASNVGLWNRTPSLYRSLLNFLVVHCTKNNNNLLSSNLLPGRFYGKLSLDDDSPTCEHFSHILKFHTEFLTNVPKQFSVETFEIIANWLNGIILQCAEYAEIFKVNVVFQNIGKQLTNISINNAHLRLQTGKCLDTLIQHHPNVNTEIFEGIYKACCIHMCSTDSQIRNKYSEIFGKLPLSLTLRTTCAPNKIFMTPKKKLTELKQLQTCLSIRDHYFQMFFDNVGFEPNTEFSSEIWQTIFTKCWIPDKKKSIEAHQNIVNNLPLLIYWIQTEIAQYCITNKLRTPLGKPQDTFMKIELLIKEYARILASKDMSKVKNAQAIVANQKRANILLSFLEYLEKVIYNASDGTAFSMTAPEKSARVFFAVNTLTCHEWFKRIRNVVNLIGLNCSEPEMVVRYSESILANNKSSDPIFTHCLISLVTALLNSRDSESLNGLFVLMKSKIGKRCIWIKYAAEQAAGYFEKAAEGYVNILNLNSDSINFERNVHEFINTQLVQCLYITQQWNELKSIVDDEKYQSMFVFSTNNMDKLARFGQTIDASVMNLTSWDHFDEEHLNSNFSYQKVILTTEKTLVTNIMLSKQQLSENQKYQIEYCKNIVQAGIEEAFRTGSSEHLNNLIILNSVVQHILASEKTKICMNKFKIDKSNGLVALTTIKKWADYFAASNYFNSFVINYDDLHLNVISLARKRSNFKLAQGELLDFFRKKQIGNVVGNDLLKMSENIQHYIVSLNGYTEIEIRGLREASKLLNSQNSVCGIQLAACCSIKILHDPEEKFTEKSSRMLLNLSNWLVQHPEQINVAADTSPLKQLIDILPDMAVSMNNDVTSVIPELDMVIGKLIQVSVKQCPNLPKVWSALGNWFYRWGRKIIEAKRGINAGLSVKDIDSIKQLITNASEDDLLEIVDILNNHQVFSDDEELDPNEQSTTDIIEQQLRTIQVLHIIPSHLITSVINIWRQAHKSKSIFYEMAADSYFRYLNLAVEDGVCSTITATLRLLRLVVKHAFGLQDVLEEGLSSTPTRPWKAIIPQLFSRLNHHEQYVRKRVSELLCRVAEDSPHLIIFPAVVGAAQKLKNNYLDSENLENRSPIEEINTAPLTLCFNSLLDILSTQTPETVKQVQLLEIELKRISLLWDEFWLHSLAQLYNEYSELFTSFENEVRKNTSDDKITLLKEKHSILIEHVVSDLKRIQSFTTRTPETNNEKEFQEKYSKLIETTIDSLERKSLNMEKPTESWQLVKNIYAVFQQKIQKNVQNSIKMADISPILAQLNNTSISMPGVETSESTPIYIKSVDNTINILPTKTKPKKLALHGSDGKKYTYLFKGLEDLHLDERIMQFLSISNSMMSKSNDAAIYRAHHYSVIPLGPQSGLISWVDEMTPLFALYKKWQQRESTRPQKSEKVYVVMRPSEIFYAKLSPLLAEQNMKTSDSRKTWPVSILRKVLEDLTTETPNDILAKELWCHSINAADWRQSIRTYSRSVAVMSVIGYVIGLGDRHLDNMLVKLSTGNIVHIDYNVCFEKGKTLGVPERVPFRMTQNIIEALGITGIEGIFRLSCEHVLKTLRKEREILLTLLEAFVYDPLVDWAISDYSSTSNSLNCNLLTRSSTAQFAAIDIAALGNLSSNADANTKDLGNSLTERRRFKRRNLNDDSRKSLKYRIADIKPEWTQYKNDLSSLLENVLKSINKLEDKRSEIQGTESTRDLLSKQLSIVQEVETLGTAMESHSLNTISQRYNTYTKSTHQFSKAKDVLTSKLNEYTEQNKIYFQLSSKDFNNIRNHELPLKLHNEFELLREFLENSAQTVLYQQAIKIRKKLDTKIIQQLETTALALDHLEQYSSIIKLCPVSMLRKDRSVLYEQCLDTLIKTPLSYKSNIEIIEQNELNEKLITAEFSESVLKYESALEKSWMLADVELKTSSELLQNSCVQDTKKKLEENMQAISVFNSSDSCAKAMLAGLLSNILGIVGDFIRYETKCVQLINDPYQYSPNAIEILDEQLTFLSQFGNLTKIVFSISTKTCGKCVAGFNLLNVAGQSLRRLQSELSNEIVNKIVTLVMSENIEVQKSFEKIVQIESDFNFESILNDLSQNINLDTTILVIMEKMTTLRNVDGIKEILFLIDNIFESCMKACLSTMLAINVLNEQSNLGDTDHLSMAKEILTKTLNSPQIIQQQFEVIKIHSLIQLITVSLNLSKSLTTNDLDCIYDVKIFQKTISSAMNIIESDIFLGLGSYLASIFESELLASLTLEPVNNNNENLTCEQLLFTTVQSNISASVFSVSLYSRAQSLSKKYIAIIKQVASNENIQTRITVQTNILQHIQKICTVHNWMYDNILAGKESKFQHILHKSDMIQNIELSLQNLQKCQTSIDSIQKEELSEIRLSINQRLKWAVGANPALSSLKGSYEDSIENNKIKLENLASIIAMVSSNIKSILSYEIVKFNKIQSDREFIMIANQYYSCWRANEAISEIISPAEMEIVELLNPEGNIDQQWVTNITGLLDDMTDNVQNKIALLEKDINVVHDNLIENAENLRTMLDQELRADLRYLIKYIFKLDNGHQKQYSQHKQFQTNYKHFLTQVCDLHIKLLSRDFTQENCRAIQKLIHSLQSELTEIYDELLNLALRTGDETLNKEKSEHFSGTPIKRKGNQPEQKRNAYAVSVWRRIRMKLEGRDPDPNRRQTISDQVDWMIREATNPDNLAVLYEGWTPWV